jgi:hypothetical protein
MTAVILLSHIVETKFLFDCATKPPLPSALLMQALNPRDVREERHPLDFIL